jgi:hypothetical protein
MNDGINEMRLLLDQIVEHLNAGTMGGVGKREVVAALASTLALTVKMR